MRTDELISMLARGVEPAARDATRRRYGVALGWGALGSLLLMLLLLGVRPDIATAVYEPMFWFKLAFPAMLLAGAVAAALRLSTPGMRLGRAAAAIAAPVIVMWLFAAVTVLAAAPGERAQLVLGHSAAVCPALIALLSLPFLAAALWAIKGLAPTRLRAAGAAVGLLAGAGGALVYALYCVEMAPPFLAAWYVLGMLVPTAAGALIGPRVLRW